MRRLELQGQQGLNFGEAPLYRNRKQQGLLDCSANSRELNSKKLSIDIQHSTMHMRQNSLQAITRNVNRRIGHYSLKLAELKEDRWMSC